MEMQTHPFRLSSDDEDDDHDLNQLWSQLIFPGKERWPSPTDQNKIYQFNFCENKKLVSAKFSVRHFDKTPKSLALKVFQRL
jgi:hypothetical protein